MDGRKKERTREKRMANRKTNKERMNVRRKEM